MARGHGRILTSIWEDADFLTLTQEQQRLYLFLISQPNLNHAGLLPMTIRRWSRKALDLNIATTITHLEALEADRFIVMDDDTEEILVRSFVRNDGVWRQPKVMAAMVSGAEEISSVKLRRALLTEMDRIPLDQLSDDPGPRGALSVRQQVTNHLARLRKILTLPDPTPPGNDPGLPDVPEEAIREARERLSEGYREPSEALAEDTTRADTCARVSGRAHAPSPAPAPTPAPERRGEGAKADRNAATAPIDDADFQLTDALRRWCATTFPNLDPDYEAAQFRDHHRAQNSRRANWPSEFQKWMRRSAKWASENQRPALRAVAGGHQPYKAPDESIYANDQGF